MTALGMAFSPQLLDDPAFEALLAEFAPLFPSTEQQVRTCA